MTELQKNAFFRCDASPQIGSGHVYRCLTLADALLVRGWRCTFLSAPGSEIIVPALADEKYNLARAPLFDLKADVLVVDHYGLDADFESSCRGWAQKILVLDDLADRRHDCDILIDQTHGRLAADYESLVPSGCAVLTGARHALLRPQFAALRAETLARREKPIDGQPRILVFLGSTNMNNATEKMLEALGAFSMVPLQIDVVLGAQAQGADRVISLALKFSHEKFHTVHCHENVKDMATLMAAADLAVGAGGTTSWERCCLGLPSLLVEIADNQNLIAANLDKAGAVLDLGRIADFRPEALHGALKTLLNDAGALIKMIERAAAICDGRGAERVADMIEQ